MEFTCWLEYVLVDLKTGTRLKQALSFANSDEAYKWVEQKKVEWIDTHRIVCPTVTLNAVGETLITTPPTQSLVERYSGAGSF